MTLRLFLVRHGQTDGNAEGRSQGLRDVPLNDRGRRQADALGERLRDMTLSEPMDPLTELLLVFAARAR